MKKLLVFAAVLPAAVAAKMIVVEDTPVPTVGQATQVMAPVSLVKTGAALGQIEAPAPKEIWTGAAGSTLSETMKAWAGKKEGWQVQWDSETDFNLKAPLSFEGTIDQAAAEAIRLYEKSPRPLRVEISLKQKYIYVTDKHIK